MAAITLDSDIQTGKQFALKYIQPYIKEIMSSDVFDDYKTALQEYLFRNGNVDIDYKLLSMEGPSHNAVFTSQVFCNGKFLGEGTGTSKKRAEQAAAKEALNKIK